MRKGLFFVIFACVSIMLWTAGCTDKKPVLSGSVAADSLSGDTIVVDTLEELISEQAIPVAADELFDDFIFNFAGSRKQQMRRILFPLTVVEGGKTVKMPRNSWKVDHFFMEQGFYTLILDERKQMELPKDTSVNHVTVERINLDKAEVEQYHFDRSTGKWMLASIHKNKIEDNDNASFLMFYHRFATDSVFQMQSLNDFVTFSGPNPDDDFEELVGEITPEQWPAFAPVDLPTGTIYNIIYGEKTAPTSQKIFLIRGISNGQEMEMTFKRSGSQWKLTKLVE